MASTACCKIDSVQCKRNADGTCTIVRRCLLTTSKGEFECECRSVRECTTDCTCTCECQCTLETAQKVQAAQGTRYHCEYTCKC
ncbi:unnamed protein product [Tenebrio molitor]|nr:unnamed protein product [Tenebrio molitor]